MASRSFHALFLRARDQHAGSAPWLYFVVFALALAHAGVVTPFVEEGLAAAESHSEWTRLVRVGNDLAELESALTALRNETTSIVAPLLERLVEDLEGDLARLDATRRQHAGKNREPPPPDEAAKGEGGDDADGAEDDPGERPAGAPGARPFLLEDGDRLADLRNAETRDRVLAALAPLADELIARPRYFDLEQRFKDDALPRLEGRLDAAAGLVPGLRGRFPEARGHWESLAGALSAFSRAARELRFEPPAEPFWWLLATADAGDRDRIEIGLKPATADEIRRPRLLAELEAAADRALSSLRDTAAELARARRQVGEPALAGRLGGLDLAALAASFPLLLGLALGAVVVWRSGRLRELGVATRLAIEHGSPPALGRWLWSHVQWRSKAGRSAASAWRAGALQTLLGYFLAMGWIAVAAVQLRQLETVDRHRLTAFTIAGAAAVLLATAHRLAVARHAILSLDDAGADHAGAALETGHAAFHEAERITIDAPEEAGHDEPDTELIDARPLRR